MIGLISVTEAFENTQKPDFNDVSNPVVQGTETETLIRKCPLCLKSVLGLHALGRHMKTAHPKLFGPYECPGTGFWNAEFAGLAKSRLFVQNATQAVKTSFCRFLPLNLCQLPILLEIGLKGVLGPILLFKH